MVWKSFKKVRSGKPSIVPPLFLFDQLQVNINCIWGKIGLHRDPSRTPGCLVLLLPEQLRPFMFLFVLHIGLLYKKNRSHWFKVSLKIQETVPVEKKVYHIPLSFCVSLFPVKIFCRTVNLGLLAYFLYKPEALQIFS